MDQFELKEKFNNEFFEEFMYESEFRALFIQMEKEQMTPYEVIEHLCKSKKELFKSLEKAVVLARPDPILIKYHKTIK